MAVLQLPVAVQLRDADAGDGGQSGAAFLRLGGRGPRKLPTDRLLVLQEICQRRGDEGIHRQPRRRPVLRGRHRAGVLHLRLDPVRRHLRRHPVAYGLHLSRIGHDLARLRGDRRAAVHRRDGQIGADRPACLAAGRDGGADSCLRPDPRGDDGDGGRVPDVAHVAPDGLRAGRAGVRDLHWRHHGAVRRDRRLRAVRHQAGDRLLDLFAARLHVRRGRRRRVPGVDVPSADARLFQGAAVPHRRVGDPCGVRRAGHAQDGRPVAADPAHLRDDVDRQPVAGRRVPVLRLFQQGRDHRGGVGVA